MKIKKFNEMFDPMGSWNPSQLNDPNDTKETLQDIISAIKEEGYDINPVRYSDNTASFYFVTEYRIEVKDGSINVEQFTITQHTPILIAKFRVTDADVTNKVADKVIEYMVDYYKTRKEQED